MESSSYQESTVLKQSLDKTKLVTANIISSFTVKRKDANR